MNRWNVRSVSPVQKRDATAASFSSKNVSNAASTSLSTSNFVTSPRPPRLPIEVPAHRLGIVYDSTSHLCERRRKVRSVDIDPLCCHDNPAILDSLFICLVHIEESRDFVEIDSDQSDVLILPCLGITRLRDQIDRR